MTDQRNALIAIVLSIAIILGFDYYFRATQPPAPPREAVTESAQQTPASAPPRTDVPAPASAPAGAATDVPVPSGTATSGRAGRLAATPRVRIESRAVSGSIALKGGVVDDLVLLRYRTEVDPDSPNVHLLSPGNGTGAYLVSFGWVPAPGSRVAVPDRTTLWKADGETLRPGRPVTLTWDNGQGLRFVRTYELDENYMFRVTQRVVNTGTSPVTLFPYGLTARFGTPPPSRVFVLHEGPVGVLRSSPEDDGSLDEIKYEEIREAPLNEALKVNAIEQKSYGGWLGFADHYWLVALIPDQKSQVNTRFSFRPEGEKYQADFLGGPRRLDPGGTVAVSSRFFAGAKVLRILEDYAARYDIPKFDLAIDFGWFYFLAKPIFRLLVVFNDWIGNLGVAILLLTLLIKILFFPLANKSYRAMGRMKKLQPEMQKLRERYKDDKQRLNQEMMALYKREKVNPAAGCLPMVIQIPVFIALYQLLFATIEMRHAPFFWWIRDLSAPDPTTFINLFGLLPFTPPPYLPEFLHIGVWPLIMGISMFLQQRLNPTPPDPIQAKVFMFLPIIFTFMLARFPSGLVIYWAWNNILSMLQQWIIMKRAGAFTSRKKPVKT